MPSPQTESKLSHIFRTLADGERNVELNRQVLSNNPEFDSYQIFSYLDTQKKNSIDACDLINYFRSKNEFINEIEAKLIILFYDSNFDCALSYPEFKPLVESDTVPVRCFNSNYNNCYINNNIDYQLYNILKGELELAKNILCLLNDIKNNPDFNIHELYHTVKTFNCIDEVSIRNFMDKNQENYLEFDISKILKRLDINRDGKIDLCEFHAFLGFPECNFCCPCNQCNYCGNCCCDLCANEVICTFHTISNCNSSLSKSFKTSFHYSPEPYNPVNLNKNFNYGNELKNKFNLNDYCSENVYQKTYENVSDNFNNNITPVFKGNSYQSSNNIRNIITNYKINDIEERKNNEQNKYNNFINNNRFNNNPHIKNNPNNPRKNYQLQNNFPQNSYISPPKHQINHNNNLNKYFNPNYNNNCPNIGKVNENLFLRVSPQRRTSPQSKTDIRTNRQQTSPNKNDEDYKTFEYSEPCCEKCCEPCCDPCCEPCDLCKNNHICCHNNSEIVCNHNCAPGCPCPICCVCIKPCEKCHKIPCACCQTCNKFPCKCCKTCGTYPCRCCSCCHTYPCKCCKFCHRDPCICCTHCPKGQCRCNAQPADDEDENFQGYENYPDNDNNYPDNKNKFQKSDLGDKSISVKYDNNHLNLIPKDQSKHFLYFLRYLMYAEGEIEEMKKNHLSTKKNFNCEDAFRIFTEKTESKITPEDLKQGLKIIGLNFTDYEIELLMHRFDLNEKGYIDFNDFFDMLVPFETAYRRMVEKRKPNSCCPCKCPQIFTPDTIEALQDVFKLMVSHEIKINELRQKLNFFGSHNDVAQFISYMKERNTIHDLIDYIKGVGIFSNEKEANLLFIRLDRKRQKVFDVGSLDWERKPV